MGVATPCRVKSSLRCRTDYNISVRRNRSRWRKQSYYYSSDFTDTNTHLWWCEEEEEEEEEKKKKKKSLIGSPIQWAFVWQLTLRSFFKEDTASKKALDSGESSHQSDSSQYIVQRIDGGKNNFNSMHVEMLALVKEIKKYSRALMLCCGLLNHRVCSWCDPVARHSGALWGCCEKTGNAVGEFKHATLLLDTWSLRAQTSTCIKMCLQQCILADMTAAKHLLGLIPPTTFKYLQHSQQSHPHTHTHTHKGTQCADQAAVGNQM